MLSQWILQAGSVIERENENENQNEISRDMMVDTSSGEICPNLEPDDPRVCDYYRCKPMPERFNHPGLTATFFAFL